MTSYKEIGGPNGLLARRLSFSGNSMRAVRINISGEQLVYMGRMHSVPEDVQQDWRWRDFTYVVYSYNTPIAGVDAAGNVMVLEHKFSPTTSRHLNMCRSWL